MQSHYSLPNPPYREHGGGEPGTLSKHGENSSQSMPHILTVQMETNLCKGIKMETNLCKGIKKEDGLAPRSIDLCPFHQVAVETAQAQATNGVKGRPWPDLEYVVVGIALPQFLQLYLGAVNLRVPRHTWTSMAPVPGHCHTITHPFTCCSILHKHLSAPNVCSLMHAVSAPPAQRQT